MAIAEPEPGPTRARVNHPGSAAHQQGVTTTVLAPAVDLDAFMARDYPGVVAAVRFIAGDRTAAEDAVQDALVRLLGNPPVEPVRSVAAWVTVVASNEARARHRRTGSERRAVERLGARRGADPDPEPAVERDDLLSALAALPLGQRQVCVMHYYLDRSVADIAADLGVSTGTVKTQLHRARTALAAVVHPTEEASRG